MCIPIRDPNHTSWFASLDLGGISGRGGIEFCSQHSEAKPRTPHSSLSLPLSLAHHSQKVKSTWQPDTDCQYKNLRKWDLGQCENSHPASSGKASLCQQIRQQIPVNFTIPGTHCCPKQSSVLVLLRLCHPWTLTSLCSHYKRPDFGIQYPCYDLYSEVLSYYPTPQDTVGQVSCG